MTVRRLLVGLALSLVVAQASAQDRNAQVLMDRVERLERALNDLSRQVSRGEPPRAPAPGAPGSLVAPAVDSPGYAQLESRLQQNEEEIRRLTGQLEEVDFRLRRLADRMDKLVNDVDFRLKELEHGRSAAAPGQPTPALSAGTGGVSPSPPTPPQAPPPPGLLVGPQPVAPAPAPVLTPPPAAPTAAVKLPEGSAKEQYDYAYGLLRRASFPEAEQAFQEFIKRNPKSDLLSNAWYWLGESHYVRKQLDAAARSYAQGYKEFPEGNKAGDTLFKLAVTMRGLNNKQLACDAFEEYLRKFPKAEARLKERAEAERKELACR